MHAKSFVHHARYAGLILVAVVALLGALLPAAVFAAPAEARYGQMGNGGNAPYNSQNYDWNRNNNDSRNNNGWNQNYRNNQPYNSPQHNYQQPYRPNDGYHQDGNSYGRCERVYVVRIGDTLSGIASRYRVSVYALMNANNIRNANRIYAGQRLCITSGYQNEMPNRWQDGPQHYQR